MTLPRATVPWVDGTGRPSREFFDHVRRLSGNASLSDETIAGLAASIAAIASALGSPDGTVEKIPPQSADDLMLVGRDSVSVFGTFAEGNAQVSLAGDTMLPPNTARYGTGADGERGWHPMVDAFEAGEGVALTLDGYRYLGELADETLLPAVGETGTAYRIEGNLYAWDGAAWANLGPPVGVVGHRLADLADTNTGTLLAITRDATGRVSGTRDATITGTVGEIEVANGDAAAGAPTLSLADFPDSGTGAAFVKLTRDAKGRVAGTEAATTDDLAEGETNQYFTEARAKAAAVADSIASGVADVAPSQRAVAEALASKLGTAGGTMTGNITVGADIWRITGATADGSDTRSIIIDAGVNLNPNRGAYVRVNGNEASSNPGAVLCISGNGADIIFSGGRLRPNGDNLYQFGQATFRWSELFAANGTINTSDAREKTPPRDLTEAEMSAAVDLARLPSIFQWLDAVAIKGNDARLHCSPTVQSVIEVMRRRGLDPFRYGFVCYDQWDEQPEIIETWEAEYAPDGSLIREQGSVISQDYRPAGDRYSLRPSELQGFIARGLVQRQDRLESRLAQIEQSLFT